MTETELEDRVRDTLRAVAAATPVMPLTRQRQRRPWLGAAIAAAAVVAVVVGLALNAGDGEQRPEVEVAAPAAEPSDLPRGFDLRTASPVFTAAGDPDTVAAAYLRSRLPRGAEVEPAVPDGEMQLVRWTSGAELEGVFATGGVHLRYVDGEWAVVAATTDSIDLSDLSYDGERLSGVIRSSSDEMLAAEILDWRGERVRNAPEPIDGQPGELALDVEHRQAPTVLRVNLLGGTILAVAEVRFEPPPLAPHRDLTRCIDEQTTREKEPTPDIVHRRCAAALDGTVITMGEGDAPAWELVATDEPSGHWVTLRWRDLVGVYRIQGGPPVTSFSQLGACCAINGDPVVVGALHPEVTGMQVILADGRSIAAETFPDPATGVRYAVVVVPEEDIPNDRRASVELRRGDQWERASEINLAVLGG